MIVQTNSGNRLTGFYRGIVVKHLSMGKCKIWIPGVYPEDYKTDPDKLPDAEQAAPLFGGSNFGNGVFSYPNIYATVWCFFANDDQNYPVYFASTLGSSMAMNKYVESAPELDDTTGKEYPYKHILNVGKTKITIFEGGQIFTETNGSKGKVQVKINNDGTIDIACDSTLQVNATDVNFITSNQFQVSAKNILLNASNQIGVNGKTSIQLKSDGIVQVTSKTSPTGKSV